jgi:hypothetical protein
MSARAPKSSKPATHVHVLPNSNSVWQAAPIGNNVCVPKASCVFLFLKQVGIRASDQDLTTMDFSFTSLLNIFDDHAMDCAVCDD